MNMKFVCHLICSLFLLIQLHAVNPRSSNNNCKIHHNRLRCIGNYPVNVKYPTNITEVYLTNLTWDNLDITDMTEIFPNVEKIFVENSLATSVFLSNRNNKIKVLSLRSTRIIKLPKYFVTFFPHLETLILEDNQLTELEENFYLGGLVKLFVSNNPWSCSNDLSWILQLNQSVATDLVNATCKGPSYPGKSVLLIAKYKEEMNRNCTKSCQCSLENVVQDPIIDKQHPIIMVNCSERGFTEIPTQLPKHTRILHLEGNLISDLRELKTNTVFEPLWDLYLDNNTITSISYLEGSHWLEHFRVFSLRGNRLAKLPAFALDNALMKNPNMPLAVVLYLGGNPWRCDCIFVPVFQELVLQKYSTRIADIKDVKCSYVEGDENSLLPIVELSRSSVCMVPSDFSLQEGLDLLNAVLASLIIFILAKLAYDYYHFKKSGRLPWIVTKMP